MVLWREAPKEGGGRDTHKDRGDKMLKVLVRACQYCVSQSKYALGVVRRGVHWEVQRRPSGVLRHIMNGKVRG